MKFKCLILTLSIILVHEVSKSQTTYFKILETGYDHYWPYSTQTNDGNFILAGRLLISPQNGNQSYPYLLKLDVFGNVLKEYIKPTNNNHTSAYGQIVPYGITQDTFLLMGAETTLLPQIIKSRVFIDVLYPNFTLNEVKSMKFPTGREAFPIGYTFINQNTIILINQTRGNSERGFTAIKIKLPTDSVSSYSLSTQLMFIYRDNRYDKVKNKLDIYHYGYHPVKDLNSNRIIQLDTNLVFSSWKSHPGGFHNTLNICEINDSMYYVTTTSRPNVWGSTFGIEVKKVTSNNDTINSLFYHGNNKTLYASGGKNTILVDNGIIITGMLNLKGEFPWQTDPAWIQITKMDNNFNIVSQYYYGGDASYFVSESIKTKDGGVFITGLKYTLESTWRSRIFILKVNDGGLVVGNNDHPLANFSEAILTPNPGTDRVRVIIGAQHTTAKFQLFDMNGRLVLENKHCTNNDFINISHLTAGAYVFRFYSGEKMIGTGKWIKK